MLKKSMMIVAFIASVFLVPVYTWACDGAGPMTHVGNVLSIDAKAKTFTLRDAQTSSPITFKANDEIINGLKDAHGMITVKYQEDGDKLNAVGVTF